MRIAGILLLTLIFAAGAWRYYQTAAPSQPQERAPLVVLHSVSDQVITDALQALGTTQSLEAIELMSTITERVVALPMMEGQTVTKGTPLVELEKDEELALLTGAKIDLLEQQREYARIEDLVRKKTIPSSELDKLQSLIDSAQARIAEANAKLAELTIVAPFDGILGLRNVSVGALARPGDVITTLDAIDKLHVNFDIPEKHLNQMTIGKKITAKSAAYPEEVFMGEIETLDSRVDPISRSIRVRATLNNQEHKLRPGMLLTLNIVNQSRRTLLVPEQAVFMRGEQHYVFTVDADNSVAEQAVIIGARQKGTVEIAEGLSTGDAIILQGLLKVKPGIKVQAQQENWRGEAA
jgi:membrane fusion protein (multidrug efflux system)